MGPAGEHFRALQIHPTRFCNLTCLHCYSSSGPHQREALDAPLLVDAITQAGAEGYNDIAFSGGEPILYGDLRRLLEHAKSLGMLTSLTSNGILLKGERLARLQGVTDLLAISLDGVPESHDTMRNAPQAFERMRANLDGVRTTGIPFGFIFTLTQHNLHELRWVTAFAVEQGASLLQIHPLEEVGRGKTELRGQRPDELEASFAYLQTIRMQAEVGNALAVRVDLVHRERLREAADRLNAGTCDARPADRSLSDIINPLVIEPDGTVVPLQYGFSRRCQVGNLHRTSFSAMAAEWKRRVFPEFRELVRERRGLRTEQGHAAHLQLVRGDLECQPRLRRRDRGLRVTPLGPPNTHAQRLEGGCVVVVGPRNSGSASCTCRTPSGAARRLKTGRRDPRDASSR
jgi:MoaA/NifB/PqqE/SkfB family radical SAM enzyme